MNTLPDTTSEPRTPAEAAAQVRDLMLRFTVPCAHCNDGVQWEGEIPGQSTTFEVCSACNGTGRQFQK